MRRASKRISHHVAISRHVTRDDMVFARYGGTCEHRGNDKPGREKFKFGHLVSDGYVTADLAHQSRQLRPHHCRASSQLFAFML